VEPVGNYASNVVHGLEERIKARRELTQALTDVAADTTEARGKASHWSDQEHRRLKIIQGKRYVTEGLAMIRYHESADAAILHLRETLAALDPTFEA